MKKCKLDSCVDLYRKCGECEHEIQEVKKSSKKVAKKATSKGQGKKVKKDNVKKNDVDDVIKSLEE